MMEPVAWMFTDPDGDLRSQVTCVRQKETEDTHSENGLLIQPLVRLSDAEARIATLEAALSKINDIRNSIIGCQKINWSEHIYPLVAALNEAGIEGQEYPEAREYVGTLIERTNAAEARAEAAEALLKEAGKALEPFAKVVQHDISTGEDDRDVFRPMPGQYARAERITVGHLRAARAIHDKIGGKDE